MTDAQSVGSEDLLSGLLGDFLDESDQLLNRLNENLMSLDEWVHAASGPAGQACDESLLNEMFRAAHSLKGLSAMLGLGDINQLTHKLENVFDAARGGRLPVEAEAVELMFRSVDRLSAMVGLLRDPGGEAVSAEEVIGQIGHLLDSAGANRPQSSQADAEKALAALVPTPVEPPVEPPPQPEASACAAPPADPFEGIEDEPEISAKYLPLFMDEADLALEKLTDSLLSLESDARPEELRRAMGIAHQIKGSAASVGLKRAARLSHLMEDLIEASLSAGGQLTPSAVNVMLQSTDALRQYVDGLRQGRPDTVVLATFVRDLVALRPALPAAASKAAQPPAPPETPFPEELRRQVAAAAPLGSAAMLGEVRFEPQLPLAGLKARLIYEKLSSLGELCHFDPAPDLLEEIDGLQRIRFGLVTDWTIERVRKRVTVVGVRGMEAVMVTHDDSPAQSGPAHEGPTADPQAARTATEVKPAAAAQRVAEKDRPIDTVRVDTDRLDQLMNLAGQLVINKARFAQISHDLKGHLEADSMARARAAITDLLEAVHQLDRTSAEIQRSVMATRMVPIGPLFHRFKRVVRDIGRAGSKDIRLVIHGEKTELDKRLIDELSDPLTHAIRNCADHGIESPEARVAAGKPPEGTITLDASHHGNSIVIRVTDDGRGLDADRILRKCLEKGLLNQAEAAKLTPREIWQMVWAPGFSTAEKVTEISGRGMGMDIVRAGIAELNGTAELDSVPGMGTTLTIKLPLTLAILPSLMVEVQGGNFSIPVESVQEIIRVPAEDLVSIGGRPAICLRNKTILLKRLDDLFSWQGVAPRDETDREGPATLVIVGETGREIALAVDRVLGEQDVVIKSIAENYKNLPGVAGATILGDGSISLILDVSALIAVLCQAGRTLQTV